LRKRNNMMMTRTTAKRIFCQRGRLVMNLNIGNTEFRI
jgi:hypothetical protein